MTGSLQVKNGKYYTVIYANDSDGKPIHKWEKTGLAVKGNKRTAEKILRERITEFEQKSVAVTKDVLFADFMVEWLDVVKTQVKASTYHQYSLIVNNSIVPYFKANKVRLRDLQPHHIQKYYNHKIKEGVSGNTVKHHHANIHKALNYALKSNWIAYNPSDRVELPKLEKFSCNFYTDAQIKKLLDLVKETNIETPVLLTATYGLRRSEVISLKWSAIDLIGNTITIQHTVVGNGKNMFFADSTKSRSSTRTLPLLPHIKKHLERVQAHQKSMRKLLGSAYINSDYVCTWDNGRLIRPEYLSHKFKRVLATSDLPTIRFHDLRHSSASLLIANGFSLKEVGEWLGHASINTTNIYAHLQYKSKVSMGEVVGEKLFSNA